MNGAQAPLPGGARDVRPAGWLRRAFAARGAELAGLVGMYLFAFGYVGSKALANIGLALLLGAFLVAIARDPKRWRGDAMMRVGVAWLGYVAALAAWRAHQGVAGSLLGPENLCLALIPMLAWATGGREARIRLVLLLSLAGLLLKLALDVRSPAWPWFDYSNTADMMGVNRNISSLMLNTAIVGVVLCLAQAVRRVARSGERGARAWAAIAVSAVLLFVLIAPWAASPSRTLWLSLVVAVAVILARMLPVRGRWVAVGAVAGVAVIVAALSRSDYFAAVLMQEGQTWRVLLSGDWSAVPDSSTGYRFRMLQMGLAQLADNPWFGVVNGGAQILRQHPDFPMSHAVQLHNGYLEVLVRTGVVGMVFFATAIALAFRAARRAVRFGRMPQPLGELLLAALLLFLLVNLTNGVVFFQHGWQYLVLFAGIAWGYAAAPPPRASSAPPKSA